MSETWISWLRVPLIPGISFHLIVRILKGQKQCVIRFGEDAGANTNQRVFPGQIMRMGGTEMIKKLIIIAVLAGLVYGAYRLMTESDFFGAKGKERKTFEDVQKQALE